MIKWNYELPEKEIAGRRCLVACENVHNNNQPCIRGGWVDCGVIVPPVKVGDMVYEIFHDDIIEGEICIVEPHEECTYLATCSKIYLWTKGHLYNEISGNTAFLTKAEALKALQKRGAE